MRGNALIGMGGITSGAEPKKTALKRFPSARIVKMDEYPHIAVVDRDGTILARAGNHSSAWAKAANVRIDNDKD